MRAALAVVLAASACAEPTPGERVNPDAVPETIEYWREPWGPGSYAQCQEMQPSFGCEYRLRLCDNGVYDVMLGDAVTWGHYALDGAVAHGIDEHPFTFDTATLSSPQYPGEWMVVADSGILDCSLEWRDGL